MSLDVYLYQYNASGTKELIFERNITHNLNELASALDVYNQIWRPDECGICFAGELIAPLSIALAKLKDGFTSYRQYEPENGWGTADGFYKFLEDYLDVCIKNPAAAVRVDR